MCRHRAFPTGVDSATPPTCNLHIGSHVTYISSTSKYCDNIAELHDMSQGESLSHVQPALTTIVDALASSTPETKAEVLQHLTSKWGLDNPITTSNSAELGSTSGSSVLQEAHSCHICQRLALTRKLSTARRIEIAVPIITSKRFIITSERVTFTKDTLRQGLYHKCSLVEWIYTLLARNLRAFQSDLAKSLTIDELTAQGNTDHLQFISSKGVLVEIKSDLRGIVGDHVNLCLAYEANPYLVDQLWNATHYETTRFHRYDRSDEDESKHAYEAFERKYNGSVEDLFRISADPCTLKASSLTKSYVRILSYP